jgi:predicted O-methyltransferase YrrM
MLQKFSKFGNSWTRVIPQHNLNPKLDQKNLDLAVDFINSAIIQDLSDVEVRSTSQEHLEYLNFWPGEHYKLLRGISHVLQPKLTVEIGTWVGMGTLALAKYSEKTITYDIRDWKSFKKTFFVESDFLQDIEQRTGDLSDFDFFEREKNIFANADLVFLDAPKNGVFEEKFLKLALPVLKPGAILILDDIKFLNMLKIWEGLEHQRIDLTSFGHASGTGIVFI